MAQMNVQMLSSRSSKVFPVWPILLVNLWCSVDRGDSINLPGSYDASIRPNSNAISDYVKVSTNVLSLQDIDPSGNHITLDLIIRKQWTDPRLAGIVEKDKIFSNRLPEIWIPKLEYSQSTSMKSDAGFPNTLILGTDGSVTQTQRLTLRMNCVMSFFKFPFDRQFCHLTMGSYSYTRVHLDLIWHGLVNEDCVIYDSEYSLISLEQDAKTERNEQGEFSRLSLCIGIRRSLAVWILCSLFPMFLILAISYATLYMNDSWKWAEGNQLTFLRIAINVFAILFLLLIQLGSSSNNPRTGAITALHVWVTWISFFVLISFLVPFLEILHFSSTSHQRQERQTKDNNAPQHSSSIHLDQKSDHHRKIYLISTLEKFAKVGAPPATAIFLIAYFAFYCS